MTLEEKGPILPPPQLSEFPQQVSKEVQSWKDITAATHWNLYNLSEPDAADFYVGKEELGHIHLDGEVHLTAGKELAAALIMNKLGKKFLYLDGWVTTSIDSAEDVSHALWLFGLNYKRIKGEPVEGLISEMVTNK